MLRSPTIVDILYRYELQYATNSQNQWLPNVVEIQTLARGLQIMNQLEDAPEGLSVTYLARHLQLEKSSVSRFLRTLHNYGYVEQDERTRRYRLGARLVALGQRRLRQFTLREQARPFLRRLVDETGECAHLAVLTREQAFYVDQVDTSASLRVSAGIGTLAPLHCTALGKVLLAFGERRPVAELPIFTPQTITDPAELGRQLERTRELGYALDDEEYTIGVRCLAAPVWGDGGVLAGAMGISGPAARLTPERLPGMAEIVTDCARACSQELQYTESATLNHVPGAEDSAQAE